MANEFKVKNGLIVIGDLTTSGTITINGALAATQSWVTSQAYLTSASLSGYATQSYVTSAISSLIDAAPAALDTLNELAAALGDDASFSTTVTNSIAGKMALYNGVGAPDFNTNITNGIYRNQGGANAPVSGSHFTMFSAFQPDGNYGWQLAASASDSLYFRFKDANFNSWVQLATRSWVTSQNYLTSYTDTLATVTSRGATTSTNISVNTITIGTDATYGAAYRSVSFGYNGDGSNRILAANNTSDGMYFMAATGQGFNFRPNGGTANLVVINSTGNVGIGTTNPEQLLHIYGLSASPLIVERGTISSNIGIRYKNATTSWYAGLTSTDNFGISYNDANLSTGLFQITPSGNVGIGTTSPSEKLTVAGDIGIYENGANRKLYISNSAGSTTVQISPNGASYFNGGNVGIGTTVPTYKLDVAGEGRVTGKFRVGGAVMLAEPGTGVLLFGSEGGNQTAIYSASAEAIRINTAGNVGIGTTSPTQKLEVNGNTWVSGTVYINRGVNSTEGYTYFDHPGTQVWKQGIFSDNTSTFSIGNGGGFTRLFNITNGGNVGIGTTSPSQKLEVNGSIGIPYTGYLISTTDTGNSIQLHNGSGVMNFYTNGSIRLSIAYATGNIGIGTTSPSFKTTISADITKSGDINPGTAQLSLEGATTPGKRMILGYDTNSNGFGFIKAGNYGVTWTTLSLQPDGGNVGIGTTSPGYKLDVNGTFASSGQTILANAFRFYTGASDGSTAYGDFRTNPATGNSIISAKTNALYFNYDHGTGGVIFCNGSTGIVGAVDGSGNANFTGTLGIGTASPSYKLDVATGNDNAIRILNSLGSNNNGLALAVGSGTPWMDFNGSSFSIKYNPNPGSWNGGANNHFTILSGGNVGIGTTNPATKLHIVSTSTTELRLENSDANNNHGFIKYETQNSSGGNLIIGTNASGGGYGALLFTANNNVDFVGGGDLRIVKSGNVGIGTYSPSGKLTVAAGASYGITASSSQRYLMQALNTSNSVNSAYGWWWFHDNNSNMGFHADGIGDILTLTRGGAMTLGGHTMWHAGNDGSGSGLDADLLDGVDSSRFVYGSGSNRRGTNNISNWNQTDYPDVAFLSSEGGSTNAPSGDYSYGMQYSFHRSGAAYRTQFVTSLYSDLDIWVRNSRDSDVWTSWKRLWHSNDFSSTNISNWNTAYGWGNHASAGYLTSVTAHTQAWSTITSTPTTISGYGITNAYTDAQIQNFFNGANSISGYNKSNWDTAYSWGNHASASYATTSYVTTQINNLINGAPGALDTLDELAAALGDDANFATTVTNSIAGKVSKAGDTMTGNINWNTQNTGLTWNMNTDGAYIKFFNTGDGDTNSRLEYSTSDNGDEYHRWVIAGVEKMNLKWGGLTVTDTIYASGGNSGNWNTAYGWGDHSSVGYALNSSLANYLPLSGGVIGGAVTINGNLTVNGTITENSSIKLKENVETSEGNLEKVVNLRPVTYNKIGSQTTELGLIAEEVAEVYPEFVQYDENGEPVGVHYSRLTAALIGAVKELNEQLQELKRNK